MGEALRCSSELIIDDAELTPLCKKSNDKRAATSTAQETAPLLVSASINATAIESDSLDLEGDALALQDQDSPDPKTAMATLGCHVEQLQAFVAARLGA